MSTSQLRKALLVWAEVAAPGDRARLLKMLGAKVEAAQDRVQRLAAELDWLEELAAGAGEPEWTEDDDWRDRYGWSPDDEEDLYEPDWAPRFRDLLRDAGALFVGGEVEAAGHAYERLFRVAATAIGTGWALGDPEDRDGLAEAAVRYLRALSDRPADAQRAAMLAEAMALIAAAGADRRDAISLAGVEAARPAALVDREAVLADWKVALGPLAGGRDFDAQLAQRLQVEVVCALSGPAGVGELARVGGPRAGELYIAWSDLARRSGDLDGAVAAAEEGIGALKAGPERAGLADRLAILADNAGETTQAASARVKAWLSAPSLERLLAAVDAGRRAGTGKATLRAMLPVRGGALGPVDRAVLQVLAGRLDDVATRRRSAEPTGRPRPGTGWEFIAVPALLVAGSDATRHDAFRGSVLEDLLSSAERVLWSPHYGLDTWAGDTEDETPRPDHGLELGDLLVEALAALRAAASRRRRFLDSGKRIVDAAVAGIVGQSLRRSYGQAAVLAVAHAEAVAMRDGVPAGDRVADAAEARYPRHSAYRREFNAARARSPLLTSRPVRR
ncbi:MAG TPA: hypothetical protein VNF50_12135 [Acidimicrobiales bacterium]|nr:hypothetical protein [Acidimicrobiales bacterium]HVC99839.1 hypothetical protein [Candidatus Dormibacteraeota bacterium]